LSELFGNRQKQSLVVFLLLLVGIIYSSMRKGESDPEVIVTRAVEELVQAAEDGDLGPFRKWLGDDVQDGSGRSKEEIVKTLFGIFFTYKNIILNTVSLDVQTATNPNIITAQLVLLMGANAPLPSDKGNFLLTFRFDGSDWRVWEIEWEDGAQYHR